MVAQLYADVGGGALPSHFGSFYCCAQFVVSRERVRARPRAIYEALLQKVLGMHDDATAARLMEWSWHYLLGEPFEQSRASVDQTLAHAMGLASLGAPSSAELRASAALFAPEERPPPNVSSALLPLLSSYSTPGASSVALGACARTIGWYFEELPKKVSRRTRHAHRIAQHKAVARSLCPQQRHHHL